MEQKTLSQEMIISVLQSEIDRFDKLYTDKKTELLRDANKLSYNAYVQEFMHMNSYTCISVELTNVLSKLICLAK